MNEPIRTQWEIRCAFNGFCKQALKCKAMNAHRDTKRQQSRAVTFSDLSPQEEKQETVLLYYFMDTSEREVAKFCNISRSIVQYRRTSSIELLKRYLEECAYDCTD